MTFKEMMRMDLDEVFFNPEEFGEEATYQGDTIVFVDQSEGTEQTSVPGVENPNRTILVREEEVPSPKPGDAMVIDNATWYVQPDPRLEGGVWTLSISKKIEKVTV